MDAPVLIKDVRLYDPADRGRTDVLLAGGRVLAIGPDLTVTLPGLVTLPGRDLIMTPGFFDQHIHVNGGGGEAGPASRCPELSFSELVACGTTNVVGVAGTDFISRSIENLLAKVRGLRAEGVDTWMYTSNYRFPPTTMSGSIGHDIFMVPECLGVKIAIGDHRSSFPTIDELIHLLADIRLAGMISGKVGVLHIHSGDIPGAFDMYREIVSRGFPIKHIRPTHCARARHVFDAAMEFNKAGGYVDITTGGSSCFGDAADAVMAALADGADERRLTLSSDGHGSMPRFDERGEMVGYAVAGVDTNLTTIRRLVNELKLPLSRALPLITSNVADSHGLSEHGRIAVGASANACLFDEGLGLRHVFARGRQLMRDGRIAVKGAFEV